MDTTTNTQPGRPGRKPTPLNAAQAKHLEKYLTAGAAQHAVGVNEDLDILRSRKLVIPATSSGRGHLIISENGRARLAAYLAEKPKKG